MNNKNNGDKDDDGNDEIFINIINIISSISIRVNMCNAEVKLATSIMKRLYEVILKIAIDNLKYILCLAAEGS